MSTYTLSNLTAELHEGAIGVEIVATIKDIQIVGGVKTQTALDLTGHTVTLLLCGKSGTIEKATTVVGIPTDGTVKAVTAAGDLVLGPLTIQAIVDEDAGDASWPTAAVKTRVWPVCPRAELSS